MGDALQRVVVGTPRWKGATAPRNRNCEAVQALPETATAARRITVLARTVEAQILPRLLLAHRGADGCANGSTDEGEGRYAEDVAELTARLLAHDISGALAYAEEFVARGASIATLYLSVLAPAARGLEEMWQQDRCDVAAVTLGIWRLQQILRAFSLRFQDGPEPDEPSRRALVTGLPGQRQTFAILMAAEFFRRAGWSVRSGAVTARNELTETVRNDWFTVVGLSIGSNGRLDALASGIRAIRRASCNRAIGVIVTGSVFDKRPELVRLAGADAVASDARQAPVQAASLVSLLAGCC